MIDHTDIYTYLSDALDQEACRTTLCSALRSRVIALRQNGISKPTLIGCLYEMTDDPYQINDDVIFEVMDMLYGWTETDNIP